MAGLSARAGEALEPVRAALLTGAREAEAAALAQARADAAATLAAARGRAAEVEARAHEAGRREGIASAAREVVRARRDAAQDELRARQEVFEEFCHRAAEGVRAAAAQRRDETRQALTRRARQVLGPQATVTPGDDGGIVAEVPGRRLDLSLTALAERALERFGARVEELWTP
ncbi:hypothetical protein ACH4UM_38785 [Streptomyces sp. NPDC020801]|uniref:hypothetical protein n=1 Tax=unclassified Streptomyces TaxID=2593676 RepID=UPI00379C73B3